MKQEPSFANGRSMFSVNTSLTLPQINHNPLHAFQKQLLPDSDYPWLSKLFFLQLVLRENILIYSSRRAEIKQLWGTLAKKLGSSAPVYIIDGLSRMEDIFTGKGQGKRLLLFDLGNLSNQSLNHLLNHPLEDTTIFLVEDAARPLRPELSDLFPLVFHDQGNEEPMELLGEKGRVDEKFDREKFQDAVAINFGQTLECKEEEGFLKSYLQLLRHNLSSKGLTLPNSRWKKMLQVLHFIGLTRQEGAFKRLAPTDCLFAPECLGRTPHELQIVSKANQQSLLQLILYYGTQKWIKQLTNHFWIQPTRRQYFLSLADKIRGRPSFFYPCSKFPETVKLQPDQTHLFYRVTGRDKKLMSDKYFEVSPNQQYKLKLQYRCNSAVIIHFGIACYDDSRNLINPVQVCRHQETEVRLLIWEGTKLIVAQQDREKLSKWKGEDSFAYERCIGVYHDGNKDKLLGIGQVIYPESDSYSKEPEKGAYKAILPDGIELSQIGFKAAREMKHLLVAGVTRLINHYEGGTYAIGKTQSGAQPEWKNVEITYKGFERGNSGKQFMLGTKWIRVVLMLNYNSGYPDFKVENVGAEVDLRDIQWNLE